MEFGIGTYGLGYVAGVLSTLSPCVLPLLPIVLGSAIAAHRFGALALTAGLMLSFTAVGIFVATLGASLGLDEAVFRSIAAVFLIATGATLMSSMLQARFAAAAAGVSNGGATLLSKIRLDGLPGQFAVGLVLGLVWSPCVGPTMGAAITLAAQGRDLARIALLMAIFGLGAGTPMVLLGALSRSAIARFRGKLMSAGSRGKFMFGAIMLLLGMFTLTGVDKNLEGLMLQLSPVWLIDLNTRF